MEAAEIASLPRRLLASLINGVVIVVPIVLAMVIGSRLFGRLDRRLSALQHLSESRRWQLALQAALLPIEIRLRNWRGPGMRVMRIRRADARTGGPVTVRSSVVRTAVVTAWRELVGAAQRPSDERFRERRRLIEADLEEARRQHPDDDAARRAAMMEVFKRHRVTPWASCVRGSLSTSLMYLPTLWSERNQTLPDRLAGIIVVRD